jgi:hypothetical protein
MTDPGATASGGDGPNGNAGSGEKKKPPLDPAMTAAVIDARYRRDVSQQPEEARARARAGWAIVSAIAAAVLAAGVLTDLDQQPLSVQVLGFAALVGWLVASALFFRAAAVDYEPKDPPEITGTEALVQHVLDSAKEERRKIENRIRVAGWVTIVPLVLTLAAFSVGLLSGPPDGFKDASIIMSRSSEHSLEQLCGRPVDQPVQGEVNDEGDETVQLRLPAHTCGRTEVETEVPQQDVRYIFGDN